MKEGKVGVKILAIVTIISVLVVIFFPEECIIKEVCLVVLDGGFAATLILIMTYYTEEQKSIYNFYVAANTYAEVLRDFSCYLAEFNAYFERRTSEEEKKILMQCIVNQLEEIYDKLCQEVLIIQKETREFEAYSLKNKKKNEIQYFMRELYDTMKFDLNCIKNCRKIYSYKELYKNTDYELLEGIYEKLVSTFIKKEEKNGKKFILVRCNKLDEKLEKFISKKWIVL